MSKKVAKKKTTTKTVKKKTKKTAKAKKKLIKANKPIKRTERKTSKKVKQNSKKPKASKGQSIFDTKTLFDDMKCKNCNWWRNKQFVGGEWMCYNSSKPKNLTENENSFCPLFIPRKSGE